MTTIFEEETDEASAQRFEEETAEIDAAPTEQSTPPDGSPGQEAAAELPLEALITPHLCGLLLSIPGIIRSKQTGHEWWRLEEAEVQILGEASQPLGVYLVRKYLGEGLGMFTTTIVALAAVYGPRQIREAQEQKRTPKPKPPTSAEGSQPSSENAGAESPSNSEHFSVPFDE